jgi:hypothetical protein
MSERFPSNDGVEDKVSRGAFLRRTGALGMATIGIGELIVAPFANARTSAEQRREDARWVQRRVLDVHVGQWRLWQALHSDRLVVLLPLHGNSMCPRLDLVHQPRQLEHVPDLLQRLTGLHIFLSIASGPRTTTA